VKKYDLSSPITYQQARSSLKIQLLLMKILGLKCGICGKPGWYRRTPQGNPLYGHPLGVRLILDHNHKTGLVRGFLCCTCNSHRLDDIDLLKKAFAYAGRGLEGVILSKEIPKDSEFSG
jgi:hypothetical protein